MARKWAAIRHGCAFSWPYFSSRSPLTLLTMRVSLVYPHFSQATQTKSATPPRSWEVCMVYSTCAQQPEKFADRPWFVVTAYICKSRNIRFPKSNASRPNRNCGTESTHGHRI
ncbi:hypothetical protein HYPSUDRAFT_678437 [Hypholoma sublateritium FD-334 SS-4]|uniref:Uncharacterized protein n=1 Tax=Hypholoma sublateritium (strain FD-334 SS-4) TaxID=945553 RepID=A0A0D2NSE6_HYPSF|nr:hypothetical protein HYPSUDRAFT_678437 [Hypholoma sublateritium FD-334 SS-4]